MTPPWHHISGTYMSFQSLSREGHICLSSPVRVNTYDIAFSVGWAYAITYQVYLLMDWSLFINRVAVSIWGGLVKNLLLKRWLVKSFLGDRGGCQNFYVHAATYVYIDESVDGMSGSENIWSSKGDANKNCLSLGVGGRHRIFFPYWPCPPLINKDQSLIILYHPSSDLPSPTPSLNPYAVSPIIWSTLNYSAYRPSLDPHTLPPLIWSTFTYPAYPLTRPLYHTTPHLIYPHLPSQSPH